MANHNDKKTCTKCKGVGGFPHLAHRNDPTGRCWKCKGKGYLILVSADKHNEEVSALVEEEQHRIFLQATKIEDNFNRSRRTDKSVLDKRLEPLRHRWVAVGNGTQDKMFKKVTAGYWK